MKNLLKHRNLIIAFVVIVIVLYIAFDQTAKGAIKAAGKKVKDAGESIKTTVKSSAGTLTPYEAWKRSASEVFTKEVYYGDQSYQGEAKDIGGIHFAHIGNKIIVRYLNDSQMWDQVTSSNLLT